MAVAFDNAAGGSNGNLGNDFVFNGLTVGAGVDRYLVVFVGAEVVPTWPTGITWDYGSSNQAMTEIGTRQQGINRYMSMWWLANPASGNKTLRVHQGAAGGWLWVSASCYTGVVQAVPENHVDEPGAASPNSASVSVLTNNAWLVMGAFGEGGTTTAGGGTTFRAGDGFASNVTAIMDSGGPKATGTQSLTATSANVIALNLIVLAPSGGGAPIDQPITVRHKQTPHSSGGALVTRGGGRIFGRAA